MKKLTIIFSIAAIFLAGCSQKELSREEAFALIKQQGQYPKVIDYDIYQSDPQHARKALDAGLETAGLMEVQQTQKISEIGKPLIRFTSKAQSYLLATPEQDQANDIQKVKLVEEDLLEVKAVKTENGGKEAVVEYTTGYKNSTPFSVLAPFDLNEKKARQAYFTLEGDAWKLKK